MKILKYSVYSALFVLFLTAVFTGQKNTGYFGLSLISVGIVGLIILLYSYNKHYREKGETRHKASLCRAGLV